MSETDPTSDVAALTVQLLSAYLANNTVASDDLADLIRTTRAALTEDAVVDDPAPEPETFTPAVSVRKSLASPEHIISLIDGKPYKTLKRHLSSHGLTPDTYRSRYNLPATYPMVAPDYAAHRRAVAQKIGLGSRKPAAGADAAEEIPDLADAAQEPLAVDAGETVASEATEAPAKPAARGSKAAKPARGGKTERAKASESGAPADDSASTEAAPQAEQSDAPAPSTRKRRASNTAKPEAATSSQPVAEEPGSSESASAAGANAAQPSDAGTDAEKPKRGRRKSTGTSDTAPTNEADNDDGEAKPASKPAAKKSSDKPKKATRMARAPKPVSGTNDDTAD
jgi:predicted transcriptional regulator